MKNPRTHAVEIVLALFTLSLAGYSAEDERPEVKNPQAEGFERPFRLKAGDKFIDATQGSAAPCLIDLYGEGKRALLVGEHGEVDRAGKASQPWVETRVRVYRNTGTDKEPRYAGFEYLKAGDKPVSVPNLDNCFVPCFADLDGDGVLDIVAGSGPGDIKFFKGLGNAKFAPPRTLCDNKGKMITPTASINVAAVDMDGDGVLDLLFTSHDEGTWWVRNVGIRTAPMFLNEKLPLKTIKGERIGDGDKGDFVDGGVSRSVNLIQSSAHYVDWDCDGKLDLICGDVSGAVIWYRNVGRDENNAPMFERGKVLIPGLSLDEEVVLPPAEGTVPRWHGWSIRVFVTDYNGDGLPDILLGDACAQSTMSDKERAEAIELCKKMEVRFNRIQQGDEAVDEAAVMEFDKLCEAYRKITNNKTVGHGWIWVYLQKPAKLQLPLCNP